MSDTGMLAELPLMDATERAMMRALFDTGLYREEEDTAEWCVVDARRIVRELRESDKEPELAAPPTPLSTRLLPQEATDEQ